jgi:alkanesulfonate monooxygenase SsuD/methylene tetrahydromethanopterin reductase-like flavin-dependent oxidoreductase (luciferase family)
VPMPIQQPYPPMSIAATSPEMQEKAADLKMGCMASASFFGIEWLGKLASMYWKRANVAPVNDGIHSFATLLYTCCAPTDEEARAIAADALYKTAEFSLRGYARLANHYPSYKYMAQAEQCLEKIKNIDWLINESGALVCGSPETCVRQLKRFEEIGVTKALLRIDGLGHKKIMESIELIGKYVIPHLNSEYRRPPAAMELHSAR